MPDLTHRADPVLLPEWMDEPCSYEEWRACIADLHQVNRLTLAYRPTLDFLEKVVARARPLDPTLSQSARKDGPPGEFAASRTQPLRIVDVGSGGGDLLRVIERWATKRGIAVKLTGIDLNPYAGRAARELTPTDSRINWITGNAFDYREPIDVVVSSLFTHHLTEPEIVDFLRWSERVAERGWFVNDLAREAVPYHLFGVLARLMRWHRFVAHDGPVSFRRAFREADWHRMAAAAGIPLSVVQLQRWTPARLCVERLK